MYINNDTDLEDYYINFYHWVMECVDDEELPPDNEVCMCEDLCKTCAWEKDLVKASVHAIWELIELDMMTKGIPL